MTTLTPGLPLVLAAMRPSFQPCGSSTENQPVAEPAGCFLLPEVEAEALLAACLLGGVVAGIS